MCPIVGLQSICVFLQLPFVCVCSRPPASSTSHLAHVSPAPTAPTHRSPLKHTHNRLTASPTYKYSTCTCTSRPVHIILTACPTCLQPIPHQPRSSIPCHRLLRAPPRLCPATATYGKPTSPTSATRHRDVQPHPCQQLHQPLRSPAAPLTQRCSHGHSTFRPPPLPRCRAN